MLLRCRWHKERRRWRYRSFIILKVNTFSRKCLIWWKLTSFAPCTDGAFHCFVLIILRPLRSSVWDFVRNLTLSGKTFHSKILKTVFCFNNVLYSLFLRVMLCQIFDPKKYTSHCKLLNSLFLLKKIITCFVVRFFFITL